MTPFCEPHSVDPLAIWCGSYGRKTPGYPIIFLSFVIFTKIPRMEKNTKLKTSVRSDLIKLWVTRIEPLACSVMGKATNLSKIDVTGLTII